jgi:hypothetical protein
MPPLSFVPDWQNTALTAGNTQLGGLYRGARQGALDDMARSGGTVGGAQFSTLGGLSKQFADRAGDLGRSVGTQAGNWTFEAGQNDINRAQQMQMFNRGQDLERQLSMLSLDQRNKELGMMRQMGQDQIPWNLLGSALGVGGAMLGSNGFWNYMGA